MDVESMKLLCYHAIGGGILVQKRIICICLIVSVGLVLSGCFPMAARILDTDSIGEAKTFEKYGIKITLTDKFTEKQSEMGFDAYYVSSFCGVMVLKEEFYLREGLAELSLEEYVTHVIKNNGHTDIDPQTKDGLWFYVVNKDQARCYSYSFKGPDAFWIVQFACRASDVPELEEMFFLWAKSVEFEQLHSAV